MSENPYILLGVDPIFQIDLKHIDQRYFKLQQDHHPDRFTQADPAQRKAAEIQSSGLNQAYQALKDPVERAKALARLLGYELELLKTSDDILQEAMMWREKVMFAKDPQGVFGEIQKVFVICLAEIEDAFKAQDFEALPSLVTRLMFLQKISQDMKKKGAP